MPPRKSLSLLVTAPSAQRSWNMSRVKSRNTLPEMKVRKTAHALGLRYRLHKRELPGTPDLVFPGRSIALFVHGCFWHRHDCPRATTPATNVEFWARKFEGNVVRDKRNAADLKKLGWHCVYVWECETKDDRKLATILKRRVVVRKP
ncbi:very short patch repair endonuclease [Tardiphaga sp. 538_B7_N1_4]|uniref:very short patch repair endonuclease n=1 Tax=Tardiphaga sp. 538_B7_N1_4 TaxID=3240778 RepID=UPI003F22763B